MRNRNRFGSMIWKIIAGAVLVVLFGFMLGWAVMLLWTWLLPPLFGLATISYLQGVGLLVLGRMLFGSFNHGHSHGRYRDSHEGWGRWKYYDEYWKKEGKAAFEAFVKQREESK